MHERLRGCASDSQRSFLQSYSSDSAAFFAADMDVEDVQVHIDREAPLTGKDNVSAFFFSCRSKFACNIHTLSDQFGRNLLMRAASEGRTDVVAQLLASGEFNVHEKSPTVRTQLLWHSLVRQCNPFVFIVGWNDCDVLRRQGRTQRHH